MTSLHDSADNQSKSTKPKRSRLGNSVANLPRQHSLDSQFSASRQYDTIKSLRKQTYYKKMMGNATAGDSVELIKTSAT